MKKFLIILFWILSVVTTSFYTYEHPEKIEQIKYYLNKNKLTWNTKLNVSKNAAAQRRTKLYVEEGTYITVHNAVNALIIKSANDVATVVAENISGSEREFAKLMTKYSRKLGMKKTTFKNASGLRNRAQLTTARDISILSRALISNFPKYYHLFSEKKFTWKDKTYKTHNRLMLNYDGADGIKTGYIQDSGFQLAFSAIRNNKRLIGVYFGGDTAKQRDQRLTFLMNKGFEKLRINNTTKENQQIVIKRITSKTKQIEKWSIEKI